MGLLERAVALVMQIPPEVWAVLLGLAGALAFPESLKRWPVTRWAMAGWSDDAYRAVIQTAAFLAGLVLTWLFWPHPRGWAVGCVVGWAAPHVYALGVLIVRWKWPALRAAAPSKED